MILNYIKLSLRLMARNPYFAFIDLMGLTVGLLVFFILWPYSQAELKSDQFIKDYQRIERPMLDFWWTDDGGENWGHLNFAAMFSSIGPRIKGHEQIEDVTRFIPQNFFNDNLTPGLRGIMILTIDQNDDLAIRLDPPGAICADRNFISFFNLEMLQGNSSTALDLAESIVVSERMAHRIFDGDAFGKQIKFNGKPFIITGIFENLPPNSQLQFDMIFSNAGQLNFWDTNADNMCYPYFKMKAPGQLAEIMNKNKESLIGEYLKKNPHIKIDFLAQPFDQAVFNQNLFEPFKTKSEFTLKVLSAVSLVVIIMAWISYINLTVARTKTRFKEIATRKVAGALLRDLFLQFACQSAVINLFAILMAFTLMQVVKQSISLAFNINTISFQDWSQDTWVFSFAILFSGILITAAYPSWLIWKNTTRQLLTKNVPSRKRVATTVLTTAQYVAALTLIAWVFVMTDQLNFILSKDIGIDKENVIVAEAPIVGMESNGIFKMKALADFVRNELGNEDACLSGRVCGEGVLDISLRRKGTDIFYGIDLQGGVDEKFISLYGLKVIAGRNFVKDEPDSVIILSRFTSRRLGFKEPEDAIGGLIEHRAEDGSWKSIKIIGVIEDYRVIPYYSSENSTEAATGRGVCLTYLNNALGSYIPQRISMKVKTEDLDVFVKKLEKYFVSQFPGNSFRWFFLDDKVKQQYGDQKISLNQITLFTALAVGVACLGLLGMISNTIVEKIKEISIRRILGADLRNLAGLLLHSTFVQIAIAVLIGLPVAWNFSGQYLQRYTEQISLHWWHFAVPVAFLMFIMLATVAIVILKATKTNPVEALKHD